MKDDDGQWGKDTYHCKDAFERIINSIRSRKSLAWGNKRGEEEDEDSDPNEHDEDDYNDADDDGSGCGS